MGKQKKKKKKRSKKQPKNKKLVWLERVAWVLSLWFLFYPKPYDILFVVLASLPIIGMFLNGQNQSTICSLVHINNDKNAKKKYDLTDVIDIPAWVILLRFILDFEIDNYSLLFVAGTVTFLLTILVLFFTHRMVKESSKSKWWIYFVVISNIALYSYGITGMTNCVFDSSRPIVYDAEVVNKSKSRRSKGGTSYYVKVTPWGHHLDQEEIRVSSSRYSKTKIGDKVKIDFKEGFLGIPWYYLE